MNPTLHLDLDLLDAVVADTCERLASLTRLPCPTDPGNQLQLLALLETGIHHALAEAVPEALDHGYTEAEIEHLRGRQASTP
jgi:cation transport ATPase